MKLSILDSVTMHPGETQQEAIQNTIKTVIHAENLGYHRYWFTEHHSSKQIISTAPDLMIALALPHVSKIRLGSGGIMLPNHASLKVAENFSILESLYPNKIDLGLGRAPGTNPQTALTLARSNAVMIHNNFGAQIEELKHYFNRSFPTSDPRHTIQISGDTNYIPNMMILGSSHGGVGFAIKHQLPFVFAGHIAPHLMVEVLNHYFEQTGNQGILALGVLCAETHEEALRLVKPYELMWLRLMQGRGTLSRVSLNEADAYQYSSVELDMLIPIREKFLVGTAETLMDQFNHLSERCKVDEIMLVDIYPDHESRINGFSLLMNAKKKDMTQ